MIGPVLLYVLAAAGTLVLVVDVIGGRRRG